MWRVSIYAISPPNDVSRDAGFPTSCGSAPRRIAESGVSGTLTPAGRFMSVREPTWMEIDMTSMKKFAATSAMAALLGVGAIVVSAPAANAETVCNRYGDCWNTYDRDDYSARFGIRYDTDDWR